MRQPETTSCIARLGASLPLIASILLFGGGASLAATASLSGCTKSAMEFKAALADRKASTAADAARREEAQAREFCINGQYETGIEHYARALALLAGHSGGRLPPDCVIDPQKVGGPQAHACRQHPQ